MKEIVIDILFVGLLVIPVALYSSANLANRVVTYCDKSIVKSKKQLLTLPVSVYLIYELSSKENWAAQSGLVVAFFLFFMIYAAAISQLIQRAGAETKPL
ncbi:hypothetical protein [Alteromonas sp. RKMC-009]|uniref:hypothetical protein n=1 Tax=Alteromonas sp. RKMC-009 TaxID=2267264 RepID=UPI0010C403F0|nr:hypothetical protein [Alteromonas sp. RKMC-009]AYA65819.2 hypothetical protein DS731_18350 [Alteromonas sp. RKMC-009]